MKIFAYGSNMCTVRLQARVDSARPVGIARLDGHTLRFHKRGWRDGSGKCDVPPSDDSADRVWGVVFEIDEAQKPALDRVEGLGHGYDQVRLPVTTLDGHTHHAWLYRADPTATDPSALPFRWYRDLVLAGALEHGLPGDYVRRHIADQATHHDPDTDRARRHRALVPA